MGSFIGTGLLQFFALPLLAVIWAILWVFGKLVGQPHGVGQTVWVVIVVAATFGVFALASILGLISGWGAGATIADGGNAGAAVRDSLVFRLARRLWPRWWRSNQRLEWP